MNLNDAIIRSSSMSSHVGANVDVPEGSRSNLAAKAKLSTHSELHRRDLSSAELRKQVVWLAKAVVTIDNYRVKDGKG